MKCYINNYVRHLVRAMALLTALSSCDSDLRELCYDHNHKGADLQVRFDWRDNPDAQPASMALAIFAEGAQPVQTAFHGRDGGVVNLLPYTYRFVGFNDDAENVFSRGTDWEAYELYAQETSFARLTRMFATTRSVPMARNTEDQNVILEPGMLWSSALGTTTLTAVGEESVTMLMEQAVTEYSFTITNVENLSYAVEVMATLSGMSGSWQPASHSGSDTECLIPFTLTGEASTLLGSVRTFGHCPGKGSNHAEHMLTIYAEMKDGSKVYFVTDVTDAMHDSNHLNPGEGGTGHTEIPIVIDKLPLPKPITNGSGLQPDVDEWTEVFVTIPMG